MSRRGEEESDRSALSGAANQSTAWQRETVSVVIPVRNEAKNIVACISAILAGSRVPDEIIVVDGQSEDGTQGLVNEIARSDARVRLLDNPRRVIPAALNLGWRAASSDIIVRVDGHATVSNTYVECAIEGLNEAGVEGIGGRKVPKSGTRIGDVIAAAMSSPWGVGNSRYHFAANKEIVDHVPFGCYRRATIESLGGWDESFLVNQDFEFDYRLRASGGLILFDPRMSTNWACSSNLRDLSHQYRRYGRGRAMTMLKHPGSASLRHVAPPALFVGTVVAASLAAVLWNPWFLAPLGPYCLLLLASLFSSAARQLKGARRLLFPLVIAVMHYSQGLGLVQGLGSGLLRRRARDTFRDRNLSALK